MSMRLLPIWMVVLLSGCPTSDPGRLERGFCAISEEARRELDAKVPQAESAKAELEKIIETAKERVEGKSADAAVEALNRLVFAELGFEREVEDDSIEFMLLPYVVKNRKGSCLGLAALYLVMAERLDIEVQAVLVPRHFFLRHRRRNIEVLRQGEAMPDEWYQKTWRVPPKATAYMRPLKPKELLAVYWFNLGNAFRMRGDYLRAYKVYERVIDSFADFAEAHANLGLVLHLQKEYQGAMQAYLRARSLQPELPGLAGNIEALKTDMGETP
jgi:regulator of sirC expression with transglutaminase-like and TPR domain